MAAVPLAGVLIAFVTGHAERLTRVAWLGLLLGILGVAALVGFDVGGSDLAPVAAVGVVVVGYPAGPAILSRPLQGLPGLGIMASALTLTAVAYVPVVLLTDGPPDPLPSAGVVASVVTLGVLCTAVAFMLLFALVGEVGPVRATTNTFLIATGLRLMQFGGRVMRASVPTIPNVMAVAVAQLERLEQAWNKANGADFGAVFADDCTFVDIRGGHHPSRSTVIAGQQALFDSLYGGSVIRYRLHSARQVTPGCIVAVAGATLDAPAGPAKGVSRVRLTRFSPSTRAHGRWPPCTTRSCRRAAEIDRIDGREARMNAHPVHRPFDGRLRRHTQCRSLTRMAASRSASCSKAS